MGVRMYFDAFGFDVEDAKNLFVLLDKERSGQVSFDDFIHGSVRLRGPARALDLAVIGDAFRNWSDHILEQHPCGMDLLERERAEVIVKESTSINANSLAENGEGSDDEVHKTSINTNSLADSGEGSDDEVHKTHEDGMFKDASVPHPPPLVIGSDASLCPLPLIADEPLALAI